MKSTVRIVQWIVGILFIVSGLVKANDPLGLGYKMEEFLELWSGSLAAGSFFARQPLISFFAFLHSHSLVLSVVMITLEIALGVALLTGWKKKTTLAALLLLMVFFTFLTGYAHLSGKFTNCGCFGDCLPISPLASFIKDLALLGLILLLLAGQRYIQPVWSPLARAAILAGSLVLVVGLQLYVLSYLPQADCLPFKKGNNISEQMKPPPGSRPDSLAIRFIYEKDGQRFEFAPESLPADFTSYKYIDRVDKVIRKGNAIPPVKGFVLTGLSGADSTAAILEQPKALLVFALDFDNRSEWMPELKQLSHKVAGRVPVYLIAATPVATAAAELEKAGISGVSPFSCDNTVVKTVARTNPTILYLEKGTVVNKWSRHGWEEASALAGGRN